VFLARSTFIIKYCEISDEIPVMDKDSPISWELNPNPPFEGAEEAQIGKTSSIVMLKKESEA
jgi:hypothetical protein